MYVYYSLRNFASALDGIRREFYNTHAAIRAIYLIGQYLSPWFLTLSNVTLRAQVEVLELAADWLQFYNWVVDSLGIGDALTDLVRYADDILSFIRNPFDWIKDAIREFSYDVRDLIDDPISFILETIYRYTGLDVDFTSNPRGIIRNIVHDIVGDALDILRDPTRLVINVLDNIIPDFGLLIYDPRRWVIEKVQDEFPYIYDLLRDPEQFIEDRIMDILERVQSRYSGRILKLAEKIIQAIF